MANKILVNNTGIPQKIWTQSAWIHAVWALLETVDYWMGQDNLHFFSAQ